MDLQYVGLTYYQVQPIFSLSVYTHINLTLLFQLELKRETTPGTIKQ